MTLPWQQDAWQKLQQMIKQNHLPHALLISGVPQIGKFELMQQLVGVLIGDDTKIKNDKARETADYPMLIRRSNYPNMIYCRAGEMNEKTKKYSKEILVEQIRAFCDALNQTAETLQIGVLFYADQMNANTANALLKTLEEPRPNTLIILLAHHHKNLPATVISRCQNVHIAPAYNQSTKTWLSEQIDSSQNADFDLGQLLENTYGVPFKVIEGLQSDGFIDYQKWQNQLLDVVNSPFKISQLKNFEGNEVKVLGCLQKILIEAIRDKSLGRESGLIELNKVVAAVNLDFLFKLLDDINRAIHLAKTPINISLLLDNIIIVWSHITHLKHYRPIINQQ